MAAEEAPELGMRWIERVRADLAGNAEALATLDGFREEFEVRAHARADAPSLGGRLPECARRAQRARPGGAHAVATTPAIGRAATVCAVSAPRARARRAASLGSPWGVCARARAEGPHRTSFLRVGGD